MRAAFHQAKSFVQRMSLRRRATAILFALLANALILLLLLKLAPEQFGSPKPDAPMVTFALAPEPAPAARQQRAVTKATSRAAPKAPDPVPEPPKTPVVPPPVMPLQMIIVSRDVFAASDVSKLPTHPEDRPAGGAGSSGSAASGAGDSQLAEGKGPGGEPLYVAEWYREPTEAEMSTYMPSASVGSYGMIACQTIARYHVDNCRELGDSPAGSGLARGMRQAAFQFLVRPPRVGGHVLIGAWVNIRIRITEHGSQ